MICGYVYAGNAKMMPHVREGLLASIITQITTNYSFSWNGDFLLGFYLLVALFIPINYEMLCMCSDGI